MLAGAIESGLMGGDLESSVRQSSRRDIVLDVDQNIKYPAALFTDEMLMALARGRASTPGAFRWRLIFADYDKRFQGLR
jgi:hypothetical protein